MIMYSLPKKFHHSFRHRRFFFLILGVVLILVVSSLWYSSEFFHSKFLKKLNNTKQSQKVSSSSSLIKSILPTLFTTPIGLDLYLIGDEMEFYDFSQLITKHFASVFEAQQFPNVFLGIIVRNSTTTKSQTVDRKIQSSERISFLVEGLRRIPNLKGWTILQDASLHDDNHFDNLLRHAANMFQYFIFFNEENDKMKKQEIQFPKNKSHHVIAVMKAHVIVNSFPNIRKNIRIVDMEKLETDLDRNKVHSHNRLPNTDIPLSTFKIDNFNLGRIWYGRVKHLKQKPFLFYGGYHEMALTFSELLSDRSSSHKHTNNHSANMSTENDRNLSQRILDKYGIRVLSDDRFEASELLTLTIKPGHLIHHQFQVIIDGKKQELGVSSLLNFKEYERRMNLK
ncbi:hypothetical protein FDP41_008647 [Naegleria fowleri]|uniref:Uncharacterized protein n=1 Tax=Naegleria fowleri TaxID=5763 RepID=A0A6A5B0M3_NAEFO|nr:uncharacterized protein FDP41_008647 [Naegleria fowleri]KAF0972983.1 hypothetical protein FDP41_008647 [Naegleria fowleri]CAG4709253.1 unnamed protein product [Naegleria fowleri]